jgi:hypothetical protein
MCILFLSQNSAPFVIPQLSQLYLFGKKLNKIALMYLLQYEEEKRFARILTK